jgi:O-antigen ligase
VRTDAVHANETSDRWAVRLQLLPLCALAWGALAFGAVYPWAYWPLAIVCLLSGLLGVLVRRQDRIASVSLALTSALMGMAVAIAVQLLPLPRAALATVSPRTIELLGNLNPAFAAGLLSSHPVSVWPRDTWTALALYVSLAVLGVGATHLFSRCGSRRFVEALTCLAAVLALVGIVQQSFSSGAIYGIWTLDAGRHPFGPFVNRNHFAGWMVMVLPLTLVLLVAGIDHGMRGLKPGWRYKVLWFSSPEASRLMLIAAAAVLMALSLMLTMSRSGITAFALSVLMTAWFAGRTVRSRSRRIVAAACLGLLLLLVVTWTGADLIATRFRDADWGEFNNRKGAWADAWTVARDFPLVGTGLNTYWAAALFYQRHDMGYFFAQAHNDYMQLAAEGGLLLAVPGLICLVFLIRDVRHAMHEHHETSTAWLRAGAVTSLVAIGCQETVEFSLQIPGNAALFAVVCAIALHRPTVRIDGVRRQVDISSPSIGRPRLRLVTPTKPAAREPAGADPGRCPPLQDFP